MSDTRLGSSPQLSTGDAQIDQAIQILSAAMKVDIEIAETATSKDGYARYPWAHLARAADEAIIAMPDWDQREQLGSHIVKAHDVLRRAYNPMVPSSDGLRRKHLLHQIPMAVALLKDNVMVPAPGAPGRWIRRRVTADHPGRTWDSIMDGHILHEFDELQTGGWAPLDGGPWFVKVTS